MRFRGRSVRSIALASGVTLVLCVPLAVSVAATANSDVLISRDRPAVASSAKNVSFAIEATSGGETGWSSADGPGTQWLRIDLGAVRRIDRVQMRWARAYAKSYRVQTSVDGSNWTDLYATRAGNGGTDDLKRLGGSGRFLRLLATQRGHGDGGYSLFDLKAYGPAEAVLPAAAPATGSLATGLDDPRKKDIALQLVASAENSTLNWRNSYGYIEDLGDGRGYTAGLIGFCTGTSDLRQVVVEYTKRKPRNILAGYLPALRTVDGSDSHAGLDPGFVAAWKVAARDPIFQRVQEAERDSMYFDPSLRIAKTDGLRALGQFAYFDAAVMHGVSGMRGIRAKAMRVAKTPAQGGDEISYLNAFLDARADEMRTQTAHSETSRVDTAQRLFLKRSNLDLTAPLTWKVYGDTYQIAP